jgi:hypothetical protein
MFSKKIVPDFSPRVAPLIQKPVVYSAPLQPPVSIPEKILISDSEKLPIFVPPVIPPSVTAPKVVTFAENPVMIFEAQTPPWLTPPFTGPTQNAAPASFSPNLETFAGIDNSYFATLADLPDPAKWSLYPAISTINMSGYSIINGATISTDTLLASSTFTNTLLASSTFTNILLASSTFTRFISTAVLDLDGNLLTTAGEELLFNGQPLATVSSISTAIVDWSLYPAISTIICDSNAIAGVTNLEVSTINNQIYPPPVPLPTWVSTATTDLDMATFAVYTSSIMNLSSINGNAYPAPVPPSSWISTASSDLNMSNYGITNVSSINGVVFPGAVADVSLWANYVASSNVTLPNRDLNMTTNTPGLAYNIAQLNANVDIGNPANAPLRPDFNAYCGNVTFGGLATPLTTMNVNSIGGINLTSVTGVNVTGGGTVTISGGGGVAVSGGGGVTVGGVGGVAITGGGAISVAAGGVSVAGGGVAITAGGLAINAGLTEIGTIGGPGGGLNVFGSDISMIPVGAITAEIYTEYLKSYSGSNTMQITGVSTINGVPPSAGAATAFSYNIYVSNISGSDTTGDGKISNPYKTITKAIAVAGTIAETNQVIINLACGTYTENLNITRDNLYITGGSTSLSTATVINGSITVDTTGSSQLILIGGLSSVYFNNFIYNNSVAKNQSYVITDCLIVPGAGTSAIVFTDTSTGGNGDITIQNSLIYMSDTTAVTISNGRISMINSQITNNPGLANATVSLITTSGTGGVNLFGCTLIQGSTSSTVQPLINMTNNASNGSPMLINSCILQYTSATADTGTGAKCCIRFSNSAAISNVSVINCLLICEGARTTNGSAGQYLAIQRTGAGTITLSYGQNLCGATANHLPATAAGLTKTAYIALGN